MPWHLMADSKAPSGLLSSSLYGTSLSSPSCPNFAQGVPSWLAALRPCPHLQLSSPYSSPDALPSITGELPSGRKVSGQP